jgi:hypothetical protein
MATFGDGRLGVMVPLRNPWLDAVSSRMKTKSAASVGHLEHMFRTLW